MWQGQRIKETDVVDASTGAPHSVLLDVRNADEWSAGHAPGARWIPLPELESARF
ncbi:MAG TPA: rhodanese-like domain-containing protein, partial [Acidimicrobiia bacterium]|nr:rhodanese-like domain-containing protein [Acidimicrobiia bacterium]